MKQKPKISVIIPAYNYDKYIGRAIDSLLLQNFTEFEIVVMDDNSTDQTGQIVQSYTDQRIRYYKNQTNLGLTANINKGFQQARGEYICFLDADDTLPARSLYVRYAAAQLTNADVVHGAIRILSPDGVKTIRPVHTEETQNIVNFLQKPQPGYGINTATFLIKRETLSQYGMRSEQGRYFPHEDYEWSLHLLRYCTFVTVKEAVYNYYLHEHSHSKKHGSSNSAAHNFAELTHYYHMVFTKILGTPTNSSTLHKASLL